MPLVRHPHGNYWFLPGIAPYSCGVVAERDFEIVHVRLGESLPLASGFDRIAEFLSTQGRPRAALCGMELRSPRPFTFDGFRDFNLEYSNRLKKWDVFVDGVNPVARTNVAPERDAPADPVLYGFSFTRPAPIGTPPTFVVAGAGELPEGLLSAEDIVEAGDTSPLGLKTKAEFVLGLMTGRLRGLEVSWSQVTTSDVYTIHSLEQLLPDVILPALGPAARLGITWDYTRPPIVGIEFEMDVRGVRTELVID